jgi:hypothetical protein
VLLLLYFEKFQTYPQLFYRVCTFSCQTCYAWGECIASNLNTFSTKAVMH